jgi:hypothetical protein
MKLDMAKFVVAPATDASPAVAASGPVAAHTAAVTVDANAPNCDIEVDGRPQSESRGNTPSTLNLTAGKDDIVVKKTGYADWTRSMAVGSGSVHLDAEMVAK